MIDLRAMRLVLLVLPLVLAGCASSFERDWKAATRVTMSTRKGDAFAGAWDGVWTSEKHRMPSGKEAGGRLRCLFTREDERHYRAKFCADWLIFSTSYAATFDTQRKGTALAFRGEHDLGAIFGGVYRYDGRVTPRHFSAAFASKYDYGRFEMDRWTPAAASVAQTSRAH